MLLVVAVVVVMMWQVVTRHSNFWTLRPRVMVMEPIQNKGCKTIHAQPRPPGLKGLREWAGGILMIIALGGSIYYILALHLAIVWCLYHGQVSTGGGKHLP